MIQLLPTFRGLESEQPYLLVREFEEVCATFDEPQCTEELIRLKLFPFSLKDKAKTWLLSLRSGSITSWREMQVQFLKRFFPTHITNGYKKQIMTFTQKEGETFYQCWERFKELLNACPHHGYEKYRVVHFFYDALTPQMRQFLESMCNGRFLDKNPAQAEAYFDWVAENAQSCWNINDGQVSVNSKETHPTGKGIYAVSDNDDLRIKIAQLTKQVETLQMSKAEPPKPTFVEESCNICEILGHSTQDCPTIPAIKDVLHSEVNAAESFRRSNNNPFSETYNPGWQNHPNFRWKNDQQTQPQFRPQQQAPQQQQPYPQPST
jgi:Retrotransposon gag protein.